LYQKRGARLGKRVREKKLWTKDSTNEKDWCARGLVGAPFIRIMQAGGTKIRCITERYGMLFKTQQECITIQDNHKKAESNDTRNHQAEGAV
jgi:hypothetical protein